MEHRLILSDRDAAAPTLAQALADGLLPRWEDTKAFVDGLRARATVAGDDTA